MRSIGHILIITAAAVCLLAVQTAHAGELDCDNNGVPDATELSGNDCNANGVLDVCENDAVGDAVEFSAGWGALVGYSPVLDLEGDTLVVGAPYSDGASLNSTGSVTIRRYVNGEWTIEQVLVGPALNAFFGAQVEVSGDYLVVSAPGYRPIGSGMKGTIYLYRYDSLTSQWLLADTYYDPASNYTGVLGGRIRFDGRWLIATRTGNGSNELASHQVFERRNDQFVKVQSLYSENASTHPIGVRRNVIVTIGYRNLGPFGDDQIVSQALIWEFGQNGWRQTGRVPLAIQDIFFGSTIGGIEVADSRVMIAHAGFGAVFIVERGQDGWDVTKVIRTFDIGASDLGDWTASLDGRFLVSGVVNGVDVVYEVMFDTDEPYLSRVESWDDALSPGMIAGHRHASVVRTVSYSHAFVRELTADCDGDGELDACAIAGGATDANNDIIPDDCQADCNQDGIPDVEQLADGDCDRNGTLDVCDIDVNDPDGDGTIAADCNANGVPDACEPDCDGNGVPDDCDLDPADPDGDGLVAPDCDANGVVDACDIDGRVRLLTLLTPSDGAVGLNFGVALAAEGDVIAVGATMEGGPTPTGRVYVYRRVGGELLEDAILLPDAGLDAVEFGRNIDIENGRIFVGEYSTLAPFVSKIAVFESVDGVWTRTGDVALDESRIPGRAFDAHGDAVATFAPGAGRITIYRLVDGAWIEPQETNAPILGTFSTQSIAMNDDYLAVADVSDSLIYVYDRALFADADFSYQYPSINPTGNVVTRPIRFLDDFIVVGYPTSRGEYQSALFGGADVLRPVNEPDVFNFNSPDPIYSIGWFPVARLVSEAAPTEIYQASAIATVGNRCFVASPGAMSNQGLVRLYTVDDPIWTERAVIASPFAGLAARFGWALAASDQYLCVATTMGHVVVYAVDGDIDNNGVIDTCEPDCDGNLYPDDFELTIDGFVAALLHDGAICVFDLNDDGDLNGLDVPVFVEQLIAGP
ncbi:MAG: hypothetical protein H6819_00060 [Phycisphaerales bacterium]|nr:hypothetical protein [Phycisphaerales bacterium]MCB9857400.1 hypothetical protein [Phycisphaerales bacterium]MCB9864985.1 hypothetical protein [Phycisphaerales bacterium]